MLADMHSHTLYSFDGHPEATPDALCEAALSRGLTHLAMTDHCDINGEIEGLYRILDKEAVMAAILAAKKKYAPRLTVLFGLELGEATQYPREAADLLAKYPYDVVLGSLHNLAGEVDFHDMDFSPEKKSDSEIAALFGRALDETEAMLDFPGIHILTHLTYMHRYVRRAGREMDFVPFYDRLAALFEKLIRKDIALELNTATLLPDGSGVPSPTKEIFALYRKCGGRLVSVGADAHHPSRIAHGFDAAARLLADIGFDELAFPTAGGILRFPINKGGNHIVH